MSSTQDTSPDCLSDSSGTPKDIPYQTEPGEPGKYTIEDIYDAITFGDGKKVNKLFIPVFKRGHSGYDRKMAHPLY